MLRKGDGTSHPTADSSCSCHYGGKLINGETFDSSCKCSRSLGVFFRSLKELLHQTTAEARRTLRRTR